MPSLEQAQHTLSVATRGPGFTDLTREVAGWLGAIDAGDGLLTLFVRHTSASLTIQENADPDVLRDLAETLEKLAPRGARYHHSVEGADDMPAHIKSMLTATSLGVPVAAGKPGARHLAGDLPDRAPRPPAHPRDRAALPRHARALTVSCACARACKLQTKARRFALEGDHAEGSPPGLLPCLLVTSCSLPCCCSCR